MEWVLFPHRNVSRLIIFFYFLTTFRLVRTVIVWGRIHGMSKVPQLFYSTNADKQTLHRRIVPSPKQREIQQERWSDLCDYLVGNLAESSGYEISSWLQGSYKFGTQVRPARKGDEFDIDLGIYFNWSGTPEDGTFSPRQIKSLVQTSLQTYATEAGEDVLEVVVPPKDRCSRVRFPGSFHIDVPSYHLDSNRDARSLATEKDVWEESDPKAYYLWFRDKFTDEDSSQVRRLIRYIKIWSGLKLTKAPPSVLLTVLVAEAYLDLTTTEADGDDTALRHLAEKIADRLENDPLVPNPVNASENLNRLSVDETMDFADKLRDLVDLADRALAASTEVETVSIWSEAFHHFFPAPELDPNDPQNRALVPVSFVPQVSVEAIPTTNGNTVFKGINRVGPIPKNCSITFKLTNVAELQPGAQARWIVRNEGEEAELTNDMGHLAGSDLGFAKENSAYRGTHYMDLVVSSSLGVILGFRRIRVEISGMLMPARNPKKPGYTRYRRH